MLTVEIIRTGIDRRTQRLVHKMKGMNTAPMRLGFWGRIDVPLAFLPVDYEGPVRFTKRGEFLSVGWLSRCPFTEEAGSSGTRIVALDVIVSLWLKKITDPEKIH